MKPVVLSEKEILDNMVLVFDEKGKLTRRIFDESGICTSQTAKKITGKNFLELKNKALGIQGRLRYRTTKEELDADIYKWYKETDRFTKDFYLAHGKFSRKPIERIYGSWNNMLLELNLPVNCLINIPDEELLAELERLLIKYGTLSAEIIKKYGKYAPVTYQERFGRLSKAYEMIGAKKILSQNNKFKIAQAAIVTLEGILGEKALREYTDERFVNPKTGWHIYIDAYFPVTNIAFEYDGSHHDKDVPLYGAKESKLELRKELDELKDEICKENKIPLLRVSHNEPVTNLHLIKKISQLLEN